MSTSTNPPTAAKAAAAQRLAFRQPPPILDSASPTEVANNLLSKGGPGLDGADPSNLIVNYIPLSMDEKAFHTLFASVGPVESSKLMVDTRSGRSRGYGFVKYSSVADAQVALHRYNGHAVGDKVLKVSIARPPSNDIQNANIYVSCLPLLWTRAELEALFSTHGEIVDCRILVNHETNTSKGVAFIRFNKHSEAIETIEKLNGFTVPPKGQPPPPGYAHCPPGGDTRRKITVKFAQMPTKADKAQRAASTESTSSQGDSRSVRASPARGSPSRNRSHSRPESEVSRASSASASSGPSQPPAPKPSAWSKPLQASLAASQATSSLVTASTTSTVSSMESSAPGGAPPSQSRAQSSVSSFQFQGGPPAPTSGARPGSSSSDPEPSWSSPPTPPNPAASSTDSLVSSAEGSTQSLNLAPGSSRPGGASASSFIAQLPASRGSSPPPLASNAPPTAADSVAQQQQQGFSTMQQQEGSTGTPGGTSARAARASLPASVAAQLETAFSALGIDPDVAFSAFAELYQSGNDDPATYAALLSLLSSKASTGTAPASTSAADGGNNTGSGPEHAGRQPHQMSASTGRIPSIGAASQGLPTNHAGSPNFASVYAARRTSSGPLPDLRRASLMSSSPSHGARHNSPMMGKIARALAANGSSPNSSFVDIRSVSRATAQDANLHHYNQHQHQQQQQQQQQQQHQHHRSSFSEPQSHVLSGWDSVLNSDSTASSSSPRAARGQNDPANPALPIPVLVSNIPPHADITFLEQLGAPFGSTPSTAELLDPSDRIPGLSYVPPQSGLIYFRTRDAAVHAATSLNGVEVLGCTLTLNLIS